MDYSKEIERRAERVFETMRPRVSDEDMRRLKDAFELAREAHAPQVRKTGEPYIFHPIAVATIAAEELMLDTNPVIAAFLHDVVEDTPYTNEDIQKRFGDDVAFLVRVVTKQKKDKYDYSKQVDNFRQMLNSVQYDIRALLVKLADRLHNMRTLSSMRPDKQMKIAGETDYFYAPLANRLGFYNVKTELENLSLKFRCPHEYDDLCRKIEAYVEERGPLRRKFCNEISHILQQEGIDAKVYVEYRKPYSLWRKMQKYGDDFNHLKYRHFIEIVYSDTQGVSEKNMALKIYSILTDHFKEKPGSLQNYIDTPKENGYQSLHFKLLPDFGNWQEVHVSSERMIKNSQIGCVAERGEDTIHRWIEKFRTVLKDLAQHNHEGDSFIENVVTSFYNDDITVYTPQGKPIVLPQKSTVIDFAYELHSQLGRNLKYALINNRLASIKTQLHRGDVVRVFTDPNSHPTVDWLDCAKTYRSRKAIKNYLNRLPKPKYDRCPICTPIPGEEVVGFKGKEHNHRVMIHKRDCPSAISLASRQGDDIVSVDFEPDATLYPVEIVIKAVDRYHMLIDLVDCITNDLNLSIESINTNTHDSIVTLTIIFGVHSFTELQSIIKHISVIPGVDEVKFSQKK
ncbi:MAG: HD domain-containing protein [Prevotella sp.]|nr:HD domain-containing protein [Prevotella sp.]